MLRVRLCKNGQPAVLLCRDPNPRQEISQSINQSINQSANQSINQSINQSANQSINQLISQSISQRIIQSFIHSFNQSVNQSINQSVNQSFILARFVEELRTCSKYEGVWMRTIVIINNYSPKWRWIVVEAARKISSTFTDTEVNNCFSIYHTSWITKSNFICDNIPTKAILFFLSCSEVNSTWLITSELANQRVWKALFTCVVYSNIH